MRMNAADTSASRAIADCTPLTVVSRSSTTEAIETFINDVSTTSTNIAIASRMPRRRSPPTAASVMGVAGSRGQDLRLLRVELGVGEDALRLEGGQFLQLRHHVRSRRRRWG